MVWTVDAFDAVCKYGALTGAQTFSLPSEYSLRNSRLDAEVKRLEAEVRRFEEAVSEFGLSVQSDGKDSMARTHLVNIITTNPTGARFVETIDISGVRRNARNTAQLLVDAAKKLQAQGYHVVSIVTDTPSVNRKAWKIIEKELPHTLCMPCGAHCMNLHLKHCFKELDGIEQLINDAKTLVKRFSNVDFARHMLRTHCRKFTVDVDHPAGRQLEMYKPGDTRFATNLRMFIRLLEVKKVLTYIVASPEYEARKFWADVKEVVDLFLPAYLALREFDSHKPASYRVYETCLELQTHYQESKSKYAKQCGDQWKKDWEYLHSQLHSAAHVLHPRYRDVKHHLDKTVWTDFLFVAERVLGAEKASKAVNQFQNYRTNQGLYGSNLAQAQIDKVEPCNWWANFGCAC